jgi:hypothetical protein
MNLKNEIILYQPDNSIKIEVKVEDENVWLTQLQMTELFETSKQNISLHVKNIIKEGELDEPSTVKDFLTVQKEGNRSVQRIVSYYNLDMIISVGYRVKSRRGVEFRIWATKTLKEYLLKGYVINQRLERLENRVTETENKINFFVKTALPTKEGVFYNGQVFDAYIFVSDLIKTAKKSIILIDNYIDESVLVLLSKRKVKVTATIYTSIITPQLKLDISKHNAQYPSVSIEKRNNIHDRFLLIDENLYHIGASIKDLGKKLFAFTKMEMDANEFLKNILEDNNKL